MPRALHRFRMLPKLQTARAKPLPNHIRAKQKGPKLYNAKRLILTSKGTKDSRVLKKIVLDPTDESWRAHVSQDVADFVDDMEAQGTRMLPVEKRDLVESPANYFSRPGNVPSGLRQQVYFPNHTISMNRFTRLGPFYASFNVPMEFSKLDMKSYLKELYDVDVVHIRSVILHSRVLRRRASNNYTRGTAYRTKSNKKMTVQLVEPFTWPTKPEDVDRSLFAPDEFYKTVKAQQDQSKKEGDYFREELDHKHRKSIAEQARDMLQGKLKWEPTWQQLPEARRMMTGQQIRLTQEEAQMRSKP